MAIAVVSVVSWTVPAVAAHISRPSYEVDSPSLDGASPWVNRPWSIGALAGLGTPVGEIGGAIEYLTSPEFSLGAGLGIGSAPHSKQGLHGALLFASRQLRGENNALFLGTALSLGPYQRGTGIELFAALGSHEDTRLYYDSALAAFLQVEIGWEMRQDDGLLIRVTGGAAAMLNPGALSCHERYDSGGLDVYPCAAPSLEIIPSVGFALGYAF